MNPIELQQTLDSLRQLPVSVSRHFIDGAHCEGQTGEILDVISPIDGSVLSSLQAGNKADIDLAVLSARQAFDDKRWSGMAPAERKKVLLRLADLIEREAQQLAVLGVRDNGTEISMALKAEPGSAAQTIRYYAEALDKTYGEIATTPADKLALIHREPVGVVGAIVPWNFPLMIGTWKIAPALAAGNSVVLKPAEAASLTLVRLAELASEAGVPDGVFNVVTGRGSEAGEALALSMDVDVLAFTGSGVVGRKLLEYSARSNLKRVFLELGGKSPNIVFDDAANLDNAAKAAVNAIFRNAGQVCIAGSRLLIQASIHDEFVESLSRHTEALKVGDPLLLSTQVGAVASAEQLGKNLQFVEQAETEGAQRVCGGKQVLADTGGYYMQPCIFTDVAADSALAQQEVFGPILAVTPFKDEADALYLANSTDYGLAAGVWTGNLGRAHRMIRDIKAGIVHVNTYGGSDLTVPLGGMGMSGNGHDKSLHAFEKYQNLKTAWVDLTAN